MITFAEIGNLEDRPGLYEIRIKDGVWLKVGTGKSLHSRLKDHERSYQSALKPVNVELELVITPTEVKSKKSILAKHLFFDFEIAPEYNLQSEEGRRRFLAERCEIAYEYCDLATAKAREREMEASGKYRYCRVVILRHGI